MMALPSALWPKTAMGEAKERSLEAELASRLAGGDRDALVEAYRAHHGEVRGFARRLVGDVALAEDLVHEVFVALPSSMSRFRRDCSLKTWIMSIAVRHAQHHVRAAQRRRAAEARLSHEPKEESRQPDAELQRRELASILTRALDALPVDQRVAFVLCEVEERTSIDVAQILGEKDGTIRARVFHAKKKLREEIARLEGDPS
jgi:RNA polymerase sigma-70 factor (ECF subfamily)